MTPPAKNYFSSNKHDAPGEILRSDYRLNEMRHGVWDILVVREKKSYHKRDDARWNGGGIQELSQE